MHDFGFQLRQLEAILRANGLATELVVVDDDIPEAQARAVLVDAMGRRGRYVISAFQREALSEPGFGCISPLAAYDRTSDPFLMLDVNPTTVDWMWVPVPAMVAALRTFGTVENGGYIVVAPKQANAG